MKPEFQIDTHTDTDADIDIDVKRCVFQESETVCVGHRHGHASHIPSFRNLKRSEKRSETRAQTIGLFDVCIHKRDLYLMCVLHIKLWTNY